MKFIVGLAIALGLSSMASAQYQPDIYGIEKISGTTHLIMIYQDPAAISAAIGGLVPALNDQKGIMFSLRSDNPATVGFTVTFIYQIRKNTYTKQLTVPRVAIGEFATKYVGISTENFTLLMPILVTEIPPTASFEF